MTDKEPRKRRKRKDVSRKDDDSHLQNVLYSRESDPDQEEEPIVLAPSHEPSKIAQIVFTILSLILVVALSFVFVALRNSQVDRDLGDEHLRLVEIANGLSEPTILPDVQIHDDIEPLVDEYDAESNILTDNFEEQPEIEPNGSTADHSTLSPLEEEPETVDIKDDVEPVLSEEQEEADTAQSESDFSDMVFDLNPDDDTQLFPVAVEAANEDVQNIDVVAAEETVPPPVDDIAIDLKNDDFTEAADDQQDTLAETDTQAEDFVQISLPIPLNTDNEPVEDIAATNTPSNEYSAAVDDVDKLIQNEEIPEAHYEDETEDDNFAYPPYEHADITNDADFQIKEQLDAIEKNVVKIPEKALKKYEALLSQHPSSPRGLYGKAGVLDRLAEVERSNKYLEEAISTYQLVMSQKGVPDKLYLLAGQKCAERMQFRGFVGKSLKLLIAMADRFPDNVDLKNKIAVGYLLIGQNGQARKVLKDIIKGHPNSGFAKVHLGFILKTDDSNYEEAIPLLSEGIASKEPGVIDGRFYFHLGDALARIGKSTQAMKVYEEGVAEKLFSSVYQRSLYNVEGLAAKPWWKPEETRYTEYFKSLEKNWLSIKAEALALAGKSQFTPESEGLQDHGEWEQFELFVRGKKISKNCASVPFTCSLIEQIPDAATCKRGQVKFSIMKPGTHVWAHTGPTNCRLRAHLGLIVPEGVRIRVANETRTWENGKVLLFDDSFEHEVWHEGSSQRLVLIVDFWHPELTLQQRASLSPI